MPPTSSAPVRAAGGVLWRRDGDATLIALVGRPAHGDWTLPKGKLDAGETEMEAAVREVAEETGHRAAPGRFLGITRYRLPEELGGRLKLVSWWAMRAEGGAFAPNAEVAELRWAEPADAEATLTHDSERELLRRFLDGPAEIGRVLLLRHCEAEQWRDGDDTSRPLTAVGRERAGRLATAVAAMALGELRASPAQRCRDTLAPAAAATGLAVAEDPRFGEHGGDLDATAAWLRARGEAGEALLVCTHAPVVAGLLERFAVDRPALLPRPARLDAGGAWCVEFTPDGLAGMSYLAPPPLPEGMA